MFTGSEDNSVSLSAASALTAKWRLIQGLGVIQGKYFSQSSVQALLAQTDAVGIRVYFGFTADLIPKLTLVASAVKADGSDILDLVLDDGSPCPPNCSASNALNS